MTALTNSLPQWYLTLYLSGEESPIDTFLACLLAMVRWCVRVALWPVDLTWAALMRADTMMYELMALGTELLFLVWLWIGEAHPHATILRIAPEWLWTILLLVMIGDHIYCIRSRDRDLRAMALMFDVIAYVWLAVVVLRSRYYFGEVFLWVFALMGVIAVLSLRSSQEGGHHGRYRT